MIRNSRIVFFFIFHLLFLFLVQQTVQVPIPDDGSTSLRRASPAASILISACLSSMTPPLSMTSDPILIQRHAGTLMCT
ncbi:FirrV-1-H4 precursor [Feldmannia irregularis virus a]|uniref:FirrV-1-H4 n=1 Tax=Feldmannia irregularis virus a TaxID=231992 RepID=Q6XLU6_9PHYC|nr:FirrV-1-H4 precursor [Feldmannia irregularis virus a]AAR26965.1 FirrV-1-H4 precursor [Feldmannia irregularis virus a]